MKKTHGRCWIAVLSVISVTFLGYAAWWSHPLFFGRSVRISEAVSPTEEAQVLATLKSEGWLEPPRFDRALLSDFLNVTKAIRFRTVEVQVEDDGIYSVTGFEGGHGGFSFTRDEVP